MTMSELDEKIAYHNKKNAYYDKKNAYYDRMYRLAVLFNLIGISVAMFSLLVIFMIYMVTKIDMIAFIGTGVLALGFILMFTGFFIGMYEVDDEKFKS